MQPPLQLRSKEIEAFHEFVDFEMDVDVEFSSDGKFDIRITETDYMDHHISPVPEVGLCVLKYKEKTTKYAAETVDEDTICFRGIPSAEDAQDVMDIIDAIIRHERIRHVLMNDLEDAIREMSGDKFEIKTEYDESDVFVFGSRSNVSLYNCGDFVMVFLESKLDDGLPHLLETFMKFNYDQIDWNNSETNVIVFEEKEYPGVDFTEHGLYQYKFDFPEETEKIREHVLMLVKILLTEE